MAAGLLDIESLDRGEIEAILDRARFFQPHPHESYRRLDVLRGKTIVNLFFEASTRTRVSFEIAAKRLGADTLSIAAQGSSASKGESLVDTLNTLAAMRPNAIVMRHAASGAPQFLARHLQIPIVNAGDGTHEHPTQALLDARTILDRLPALEGLRRNRPLRAAIFASARTGATRARRASGVRHDGGDPRRGRHHDAARATGAAARGPHGRERILSFLWPAPRTPRAGPAGRDCDAPGAHQSGARAEFGGRRQPALGDPESGGERGCGAHGRTGTSSMWGRRFRLPGLSL